MQRGDVWWASLPGAAGRRPVVLVSRASAYAARTSVSVAEVSTTIRGIASEVPLGKRDGLPRRCAANTDNLSTVPMAWLASKITSLSARRVHELDRALAFSLGLPFQDQG